MEEYVEKCEMFHSWSIKSGSLKLCLNEGDKQLRQKLLFLKDNDFLR